MPQRVVILDVADLRSSCIGTAPTLRWAVLDCGEKGYTMGAARKKLARAIYLHSVGLALCTASIGAHASWMYCKLNAADCIPIQGALVPFDDAEAMLEDCRSLTRGDIGATAMRMSIAKILDVSKNNPTHPLLRAQLAYSTLHDSPLRFDRTIAIEHRYPHVRLACGQVFSDMNR